MAPAAAKSSNGNATKKRAARVASPAARTTKEDNKSTPEPGPAAVAAPKRATRVSSPAQRTKKEDDELTVVPGPAGVAAPKRAARVASPAPRTAKEDDKSTVVAGIAVATCLGDENVAPNHGAETVGDSETATCAVEVPQEDVSRFARLKAFGACCGARRIASLGMLAAAAVAAASAHRMGMFDSMTVNSVTAAFAQRKDVFDSVTVKFVLLVAAVRAQPWLAARVVGLVTLLATFLIACRGYSSRWGLPPVARHVASCRGRYGVLLLLLLSVGIAVVMTDVQTLVGLKSKLISYVGSLDLLQTLMGLKSKLISYVGSIDLLHALERTQQTFARMQGVKLWSVVVFIAVVLAGVLFKTTAAVWRTFVKA
eukprot:TRINITY_DN2431_c0_g3_i1.p1 TRINITY_DN2431_c0_g3~~TRINITY_DN2431_c0_g3_i1.p1  ORF type:complete len:394 (+),score=68.76 TRINITY_DN2431_c0_g3_i1:76-1182(+)